MGYKKQNFANGVVLTAAHLNHMEDGIASAAEAGGGSGLNSAAKSLLLTILRNAAYTSDQSLNISALEVALNKTDEEEDVVFYTVSNKLSNVTTDNAAGTAFENEAYTATLTAADGYKLGNVTVTMGGVDVTADVYADGVISIASVTGDIVITAEGSDGTISVTWEAGCINNSGIISGGSHSNIFDVRDATKLYVITTNKGWTDCKLRTFNSLDDEVGAGTGQVSGDQTYIDGDPATENRGDTMTFDVSSLSFACISLGSYTADVATSSITVRKE